MDTEVTNQNNNIWNTLDEQTIDKIGLVYIYNITRLQVVVFTYI